MPTMHPDGDEAARGIAAGEGRVALPIAGAFWLIGAAIAAILVPFDPPTAQIGDAGWAIAAIGIAGCVAIGITRLGTSISAPIVGGGNLAPYLAVILILALEWSAGGRASPYHYLLMLPVLFVAGTGSRKQVLSFAAMLSVAIWIPLVYQEVSRRLVLDIATQLLMTLAIGATVWILFMMLRAARGTIDDQRVAAETMAREDSLTGLGNRRAFHEALSREIARARRAAEPLSLLIGDLDGFKLINDSQGHAAGDESLRGVAEALRSSGRGADECFRWGGDEFAILLPDADSQQAAEVAERMRQAIAALRTKPSDPLLGITFGVAELERGADPEALIAAADRDLLARKRMVVPAL